MIVTASPKRTAPASQVRFGMRVEIVGDRGRLRAHRAPAVAAVGVELQVGDVGAVAFQLLHRLERRCRVARDAEVVAVQVQRMRQAPGRRRSAASAAMILPAVTVL